MRRLAVIIAMVVLGWCGGRTSPPKTTPDTTQLPGRVVRQRILFDSAA